MVKVLVLSEVGDFAKWKAVFDANVETRKSAGMVSQKVFQLEGHPGSLGILMEWESEEKVKAYNSSAALRNAQVKAGVNSVGGAFLLMPLQ